MDTLLNNPDLQSLNAIFAQHGHNLFFVGGCVRDSLMKIAPKDIDLATSATPDEQIAIYATHQIKYFETGLQHGTLTILLDQPYEITTFRTETNHDGRHADVTFTRDITLDLSRRDFTMNAIAMDFDGKLIDPFDGSNDIWNRKVRFVGVARERLEEDYLRALRYFRFFGRFTDEVVSNTDDDAITAIVETREGLRQISVERIWSEISKIVAGPNAAMVLNMMQMMGVSDVIGLPSGFSASVDIAQSVTRDPVILMGVLLRTPDLTALASGWKWANDDKKTARFIAERIGFPYPLARAKREIVEGGNRATIETLVALHRLYDSEAPDVEIIKAWTAPVFPVSGSDLISSGMTPGPEMGTWMKENRERWIVSDYTLSRDDLMGVVQ